ncbi:MAG: hypothetical protein B7Z66_05325 [Chromatiales bacterium 21-64-14]|nr:MAG: hypothetical protein B7Z66_05325 [Chromatiales bacterium 21-64-14]HQU15089.1 ATP-binding protein [Gammaproteobacteria bacterium]
MSHEATRRAQQLTDAFYTFNEMSLQLAASYRELETRVAELSQELAAARSERLQQLAEKERLADRLARLLEALPGAVIVLDGSGRVQECNPAARELLETPLVGEPWPELARRTFVPQPGSGHELRLRDGRQVTVSVRPLAAEPGQILLLQDVTEHRALEEQLSRHQRLSAMGEMAASLAHQIRTPLASALLYASNLARGAALGEAERGRFAERIVARLKHLERMVNDMLQFARGGHFGIEEISVDGLLAAVQQHLEPQLQAAGARLALENATRCACLHGSRDALIGALHNLATNALQATPHQARLRLVVRQESSGYLIFEFSDNGPGIPEEIRERIFEPFFTTRSDGTGLGLAVVHAVVRAHHGDLSVVTTPGQGATFLIRLPMAEAALPAALSETSVATPADSERPALSRSTV